MANEYRATTVALEVLEAQNVEVIHRVTSVSAEVAQVDDEATDITATSVGLEVSQVDDDVTDIKASLVALEVLRSIGDAAPGTLQELALAFTADGLMAVDVAEGIGLRLAFRGEGQVSLLDLEIGDLFRCEAAEVTAWTRNTPQGPSWSRGTVGSTTWACVEDAVPDDGVDVLVRVNGDAIVRVNGDRIKLIG